MKASGQRTSVQITDPSSATHVLRFSVALDADDTLRLALSAFLKACSLVITPTTRAAVNRLGLEEAMVDQEKWLNRLQ